MKRSGCVVCLAIAFAFAGCISAERKAEYAAWQSSDDGMCSISIEVFESQYRQGWRERAEQKKQIRLAKEAEDAAERERIIKERAEAERVRRAKEAAERAEKVRLAMRTALYEKTVEHDLAAIKECYSKHHRYENPFLGDRRRNNDKKGDWLAKWASPRLDISETDALAGEALLTTFGTKYLPNAYANYEKKRDELMELQQVFNEEFPQPWEIRERNPKWNSFNKFLEKFVKTRTEVFLCHDELCYYWLLNRFGVLSDNDFATIDTRRLAVNLLPENFGRTDCEHLKLRPVEDKISEFALKYAPESNAIYQKMLREFNELDVLLSEISKQRLQMDDVRYSRVIVAADAKRNNLVSEINSLLVRLQEWYADHRMAEKSSEDIAKCDADMGRQLKPFVDALPNYIKERAFGPVIADSEMIAIPGRRYCMQRTEVTQLQWMEVMGDNPSEFRGPDHPVENVSWNDCQEFIKRVSQMDGRTYRLPSAEEWEYACRAGSTGDWGMRANGECGPLEAMGWYSDSCRWYSNKGTHPVAQLHPNAWGLFDMHGNVNEWCQDLKGDYCRVYRGGCYDDNLSYSRADCVFDNSPTYYSKRVGFRLAVSGN